MPCHTIDHSRILSTKSISEHPGHTHETTHLQADSDLRSSHNQLRPRCPRCNSTVCICGNGMNKCDHSRPRCPRCNSTVCICDNGANRYEHGRPRCPRCNSTVCICGNGMKRNEYKRPRCPRCNSTVCICGNGWQPHQQHNETRMGKSLEVSDVSACGDWRRSSWWRSNVRCNECRNMLYIGTWEAECEASACKTPLYTTANMLKLSEAKTLLQNDYLPVEAGHGLTSDNMHHIAASTYMPNVTPAMIDWWFGFIHTTDQYLLWHPRDHVFSDWEGPRDNNSQYIGGHHLVHEYIGGVLQKLKISFVDPSTYFGQDWKADFEAAGYGTAICGRGGMWDQDSGEVTYTSHLIHLVKTEPYGCRMRSRFWLGDVQMPDGEGTFQVGDQIPEEMTAGLLKHCTEEMAILAAKLPDLYARFSRKKDQGPPKSSL